MLSYLIPVAILISVVALGLLLWLGQYWSWPGKKDKQVRKPKK